MQDEPTPIELIKAVADFLRNDITPLISGHQAFKLRVAVNILDLVTRQLTQEEGGDAREVERLRALLGMDGSVADLNRALADRIARGEIDLAQRRDLPSICGRPRWTSSRSISRITRHTSGSWGDRRVGRPRSILAVIARLVRNCAQGRAIQYSRDGSD
ncbi:hypothetical protein ABIF44_008270 [Bradyrhizobium japonicum]